MLVWATRFIKFPEPGSYPVQIVGFLRVLRTASITDENLVPDEILETEWYQPREALIRVVDRPSTLCWQHGSVGVWRGVRWREWPTLRHVVASDAFLEIVDGAIDN